MIHKSNYTKLIITSVLYETFELTLCVSQDEKNARRNKWEKALVKLSNL